MRKLVVLLMAVCLIFSACNNKPTEVDAPAKNVAKPSKTTAGLAIRRDVPFDPYGTTDKINLDLLKLIFEPLFESTKDYSYKNLLASSLTFENNLLKVKLKSGVTFHDKSALTSDDVVFSFEKAKNSSLYAPKLANVNKASAADSLTVVFELNSVNTSTPVLLDFPIIKNERKFSVSGTGKYIYKGSYLEANPKFKTNIKKINLISVKSVEDLILNIENGKLSAVSVDTVDADDRLTGKLGSTAAVTVTNTLTYIGINTRKNGLNDANFRKALSFAIGREALYKDIKGTQMVFSPVNPLWKFFDKSAAPDGGLSEAAGAFKSAGFAKGTDGRWYKSSGYSKYSPSFSLLVNADNRTKVMVAEKIAKELTSAGIQVSVTKAGFQSYKQRVSSGSFDLYLGEVKVPADMNLSSLVGTNGSLNKGGYSNNILDSQIALYKSAKDEASKATAAREYISILYKDMPLIPVYFNTTTLITDKSLDAGLQQTANNIYGGIENWKFKA